MAKLINLEGKKFNFLTVIEESLIIKKDRLTRWDCVCDCGEHITVEGTYLVRSVKKSCGCKNFENLSGEKFGFLTAIERVMIKNKKPKWKCLCDCGNYTSVSYRNLKGGDIFSCGCSTRRRDRELSVWKTIYFKYFKHAAKEREIIFNLTIDELKEICTKPCHYCNKSHSSHRKDRYFKENGIEVFYNGLDRVDSNKGYTTDNVVPCCKRCNAAKNDMTVDEFKAWIIKIYNFYIKPTLII